MINTVNNLEEMENQATVLLEDGKLRRSERLLKNMIAINPNCLGAHFHLARVYRRTGQYKTALYHAQRTLELNPKEPNAHLNLGLIFELKGEDNLAAVNYRKELSKNPTSAETLWNFGRLCFRKHQWRRASKYLRRCVELDCMFEIEETVDKLGYCYHKLRDVQSYVDVFKNYVQMFPNASWAIANLGRALLQAKDYKGAVLRLSTAKRLRNTKSVDEELAKAKRMLSKVTASRNGLP